MNKITDDMDALLFDLDGTVLDSMWIWDDIDRNYLNSCSKDEIRLFQQHIEGMSFTETAVFMKEYFSLSDNVDKIIQDLIDMAYDRYAHKVVCKRGVLHFLDEMKNQGKKMAITTSNARQLAVVSLDSCGILSYFDLILTASEVERGKPSPDIYLEAARRLNIPAERCLVFEDIPMGIMAGKSAGMRVCAMEDDCAAHQKDEIKGLADYYIDDFEQVLSGEHEALI